MYELFAYQKENVKFCLDHRYVLIGDEMGLGKTLVGIDLIGKLKIRTLIICPVVLMLNWKKEIKNFIQKDAHLADKRDCLEKEIIIISYDMLEKIPSVWEGRKLIICDESHFLKSMHSRRTKAVHILMEIHRPEYFILLSGTPIKNRVMEFYSPLKLLGKCWFGTNGELLDNHFKNMQEFVEHFSFPIQKRIRGRPCVSWEGLKNTEDLQAILKDKYIRHTCEECLDLPPLIEVYKVVSTPKVDHLESDLALAFAQAELGKYSEFISTVKRSSAMSKTIATTEYIENILEQDEEPVLVFSDHVDAVNMISRLLTKKGYEGAEITGITGMAVRQRLVEEFQRGNLNYLACTIAAMGYGWTLTAAAHVIFNDSSWVPADLDQAMKRIHRIGQTKKCFCHYLYCNDIDRMIYRTISSKRRTIENAVRTKNN